MLYYYWHTEHCMLLWHFQIRCIFIFLPSLLPIPLATPIPFTHIQWPLLWFSVTWVLPYFLNTIFFFFSCSPLQFHTLDLYSCPLVCSDVSRGPHKKKTMWLLSLWVWVTLFNILSRSIYFPANFINFSLHLVKNSTVYLFTFSSDIHLLWTSRLVPFPCLWG